jgi:RND family efflux transporter MFP subunit
MGVPASERVGGSAGAEPPGKMTDLKDDLAALRIERGPERGNAGRWIGWIVGLLLLGGAGVFGWKWLTRERPVEVQVSAVTERAAGAQAAVLNASGYVTARRRATVSSKVTGKVIEVNVEEGMSVKEGQVLARLDDAMPRAALALAEAQADGARRAVHENEVRLDQANLTLKRLSDLLKDGIVTQADVDTAKTDVDSTRARISALQQQINIAVRQVELQKTDLDNMVIRAPFSGVAISKDAQPGEMVSPVSAGGGFTRTGICTIVDMKSLEIEVDVNESYLNRVKAGQDVSATLDAYPDWQIPAHVITVVPTADRQKATVLVRIGFKKLEPRILPDMGVKVTFLRDSKDAALPATQPVTLAPKDAIKKEGNQSYAFIVHGDVVERRAVRTGGTDGDRVEVVAGLRAGDRVVVTPPDTLKDGMKIVVK